MKNRIEELFSALRPDNWRRELGFSEDISAINDIVFNDEADDDEIIEIIKNWLQRNQPCLFGRIAARLDLITFCILREVDLFDSYENINRKIQTARLNWTQDAFNGRKSGFIIFVISQKLAVSEPSKETMEIAKEICSLYLETEIDENNIYLDQLFLEKPFEENEIWRFYTGINYFSSQGDKRWWHDHRIPGGMAFSVNSVAHMVKSGRIAADLSELKSDIAISNSEWIKTPVDSLEKALELAMRTISLAADTASGKATNLLPLEDSNDSLPSCPVALPPGLRDKNHCQYTGFYHTDYTLPSEYFVPDVSRPESSPSYNLDFTYLFHKSIDNPDHSTMGEGKRIRSSKTSEKRLSLDKSLFGRVDTVDKKIYEQILDQLSK